MSSRESGGIPDAVRVWDPVVRIGHWLLVAAFATSYLTEGKPEWLHSWSGYLIAIVVAIRMAWGFIGTHYARFGEFIRGPITALIYLKNLANGRAERHIGHSPPGGLMILALLLLLAATATSGMMLLAVDEGRGPLAGIVTAQSLGKNKTISAAATVGEENGEGEKNEGGEELLEEVHEVLANLTLLLVIVHILGVAAASFAHRENLPRSMVTGWKRR